MKEESGAPAERAAAPERARTARYGIRWHARDAARLARFRCGTAHPATVAGTAFACWGLVILGVTLLLGRGAPWTTPLYTDAAVLCAVGAALRAVARRRRWRR